MVTKKQKKIIKDIKKSSKELKEKGLTSLEIILIVTSIFILAGGLTVYALLGIHIDDLKNKIKKRTKFIKSLMTSLKNEAKNLKTQTNQNQRLLQENEKSKKLLDKFKKENQVLKKAVEDLTNKHKRYKDRLVTIEEEFVKKDNSLTLTTNEKNKLEKNKKILEKEIGVLMKKNIELEREIIKYHQNIARKRQLQNKTPRKKIPWKPSGGREYPYTRKLLNKNFLNKN